MKIFIICCFIFLVYIWIKICSKYSHQIGESIVNIINSMFGIDEVEEKQIPKFTIDELDEIDNDLNQPCFFCSKKNCTTICDREYNYLLEQRKIFDRKENYVK